jgi:ubiquitin-associated SH3 domain-containing protein
MAKPRIITTGMDLRELIVYACPVGPLADQLQRYFACAQRDFGPNAAHRYPAHITLTGFFHDVPASVPSYLSCLSRSLKQAEYPASIVITDLMCDPHFHGLLIESAWLKQVMAHFALLAQSSTRADALRLKDWLHLSLAYEFLSNQHDGLSALARECIDLHTPVDWEVRFYERAGQAWCCHGTWSLSKKDLIHG